MRVQVKKLSEGPGPGEVVVEIETTSGGVEEIVLHVRAISEDAIEIGFPIDSLEDSYLVELPRESTSGRWRVWVPNSSVIQS